MKEHMCGNCAYFQQHYSLDEKKIFRVYCGHCKFVKVRKKYPDSPACENFVPGEPDENAFVNKEYLGKELLRYVMQLDLLPEIGDYE